MKVLYISQYYPPESCAPATRVDCFTREWVQSGADVRVLTGFPNHPEGVVHADYRKRWWHGFMREEREGVRVYRTWLYPSANKKLWGRGASFASFALSSAMVGPFVVPSNGVVIATSPQILTGVSGWAVGSLRFQPWVFEVRDLWPESLVGVGQASANSLLYRSVGKVANFLYRHATHIVVDGEWKRRHLLQQGVEESRISVIRNGIEEDFCLAPNSDQAERARFELRKELGLRDEFVLLYAGTLGMAHGLETVLQAAERLKGNRDITFLLLGPGAKRKQLSQIVDRLRLSNVRILDKQPRDRIPAFLAAVDVCLVPLRNQEVFKSAIPSKMFEAMGAGKPVILGIEGEAKEILLDSQAGLGVRPEDPEDLVAAILKLHDEPALCQVMGRNGRQAAWEKYSRRTQAALYLKLLSELCARRKVLAAAGPRALREKAELRIRD